MIISMGMGLTDLKRRALAQRLKPLIEMAQYVTEREASEAWDDPSEPKPESDDLPLDQARQWQ
jgi:hypothetical protein